MHLTNPLPFALLKLFPLLTPIHALDYISTYNLLTPSTGTRWDATLIDTPNNVTCKITYKSTRFSLLTPDSSGYLSSPIPILIPCSDVNYIVTTTVGVETSVIRYTVPGRESFVFESGVRSVLEDGEVAHLAYGVEMSADGV